MQFQNLFVPLLFFFNLFFTRYHPCKQPFSLLLPPSFYLCSCILVTPVSRCTYLVSSGILFDILLYYSLEQILSISISSASYDVTKTAGTSHLFTSFLLLYILMDTVKPVWCRSSSTASLSFPVFFVTHSFLCSYLLWSLQAVSCCC